MNAEYAFVFNGTGDWKLSVSADWELDIVEFEDNPKVLGHRKIEGQICKVVQFSDGKLIAIK